MRQQLREYSDEAAVKQGDQHSCLLPRATAARTAAFGEAASISSHTVSRSTTSELRSVTAGPDGGDIDRGMVGAIIGAKDRIKPYCLINVGLDARWGHTSGWGFGQGRSNLALAAQLILWGKKVSG